MEIEGLGPEKELRLFIDILQTWFMKTQQFLDDKSEAFPEDFRLDINEYIERQRIALAEYRKVTEYIEQAEKPKGGAE